MIKITYTEKRTCYVDETRFPEFVISEENLPTEVETVADYTEYMKEDMPSIKAYYENNLKSLQNYMNKTATMMSLFNTYEEEEVPFVIKSEKPISQLNFEIVD